jgi:flavin-binding protein dodecin
MGNVARTTEISARSEKSFDDAVRVGLQRATRTLRNVEGAWVKEQKVKVTNGEIDTFQVDLLVTFVLEDDENIG